MYRNVARGSRVLEVVDPLKEWCVGQLLQMKLPRLLTKGKVIITSSFCVPRAFRVSISSSGVYPESVPLAWESEIAVSGTGFSPSGLLSCVFRRGDTATNQSVATSPGVESLVLWTSPARFLSTEAVMCTTASVVEGMASSASTPLPGKNAPPIIQVGVSNNGVETDGSWADLALSDAPILVSATPSAGPKSGCTTVTVFGQGLLNSSGLSCAFGTTPTPGVFVDAGKVLCRTPKLEDSVPAEGDDAAPVTVALRVSNNGVSYSSEELEFLYVPEATVSAVSPRVVSTEDVASGSAVVSISGTGFAQYLEESGGDDGNRGRRLLATNTTCRFSGIGDSLAVLVRPTMITCGLPAVNATPGVVAVSVSLNGHDFPASEKGVSLALAMTPRAGSLFPGTGPSSGGTVVQVFGDNFGGDVDPLVCTFQFGGDVLLDVAAEYDGPGSVRCTTPPRPITGEETKSAASAADREAMMAVVRVQRASMQMVPNGSNLTPGVEFAYYTTPTVSSLIPQTGPAGTLVDVSGEGFVDTAGLTCRFGDTTVTPVEYKSDKVVVCRAPRQKADEGIAAVEISNNMVDWTTSKVIFAYRPRAVIESITPKVGPVNGSTIVRVVGSNFPASGIGGSSSGGGVSEGSTANLSCRFGSVLVPATAASTVDSGELFCVSPATDSPGSVSLEVVENGLDVTDSGWRFDYIPDVNVTGAYPLTGPEGGNTKVTITGPGFLGSETVVCQFGAAGYRVSGRWVSRTSLMCDTPPQRPGSVRLAISTNGQQFTDAGLVFAYQPQAAVLSVSPRSGSVHGGTVVSVRGAGFVNSTEVACSFGDRIGNAEYLDPALVLCRAPAAEKGAQNDESSSVPVRIANNGVDFTDSDGPGVMFEYVPSFELLFVDPTGGPMTGGTALRVEGVGFSAAGNLSCVVNGLQIDTVVETTGHLACVTPPAPNAGVVDVRLTNNGVEMSSSAVRFHYHPPIEVDSVYPTSVPENGGSRLLVTGSGFTDMSALACVFVFSSATTPQATQTETAGVYHSDSLVSCGSPEGVGVGPAVLHVTNNGVEASNSGVPFMVTSTSTVTTLWPSSGSNNGGTVVRVQGTGFLNSTTAFCRFGDGGIVSVDAIFDSTSVVCTSPPKGDTLPTQVTVEVTNNGLDWTSSGVVYTYLPPTTITGVSPKVGPLSGGTVVRVSGSGFEDATAGSGKKLLCRFGQSVVTAAMAGVSGDALCVAPTYQSVGAVSFEVSINGVEYTSDGWTFHYSPEISVESAWPLAGPESGGTVVTVTGMGFVDVHAIMCEFGSLGTLVPGRWMDSTTVTCVSPPHMPGAAILRLSVNGQQFIETGLTFQYLIESTVRAITPSSGPQQGGTVVEVDGTGFVNSTGLSCRLAGRRLPATFVDSGRVRCTTPTSVTSLAMPLEVSNNGIDFTNSSTVHFTFVPALDIRHLWPMSGPIGGGTSVSMYGAGFASGKSKVLCIFGGDRAHTTLATVHSDDELSCPTPPLGDSSPTGATVRVELTNNNGVDRVASPMNFSYVPPIHLFSVSPSQSGEEGGVTAVVTGENFLPSTSLSCRFGGQDATPAAFISSKQVSCLAPASPAGPRQVSLTVSNNGQDFAARSPLVYTYLSAFTLTSNEPSAGPVDGGTEILLAGTGLSQTGPWACVFGENVAVPATQLASGRLRCKSPPQPPGVAKLRVFRSSSPLASAVSGAMAAAATDSFRDFGLRFDYQGTVYISSVEPRSGSTAGGTPVTLRGFGFGNSSSTLTCGFGEQNGQILRSPALHASPGVAVCSSPPRLPRERHSSGATFFDGDNPSVVSVTLSLNGADFTTRGPQYIYYEPIEVLGLFPAVGSVNGGMVITVVGRHFLPSETLSCRFGSFAASPGEYLSSDVIRCTAPPSPDGPIKVEVSVSNNLLEFSAPSAATTFEYHPQARPEGFHPRAGPLSGGTVITVEGGTFSTATAQHACRFGKAVVKATLQSPAQITCQAPPSSFEKSVLVQVTINGEEWEDVGDGGGLTFRYYQAPEVEVLHPSTGPPIGGTHLSVFGRHFSPVAGVGPVLCRVGNSSGTAVHQVSPALGWEGSSRFGEGAGGDVVTCKVPDLGADDFTAVEVAVSTDGGVHFSSPPLMFSYVQVRQYLCESARKTAVVFSRGPITCTEDKMVLLIVSRAHDVLIYMCVSKWRPPAVVVQRGTVSSTPA